jgi:hypothetical protein
MSGARGCFNCGGCALSLLSLSPSIPLFFIHSLILDLQYHSSRPTSPLPLLIRSYTTNHTTLSYIPILKGALLTVFCVFFLHFPQYTIQHTTYTYETPGACRWRCRGANILLSTKNLRGGAENRLAVLRCTRGRWR